MRIYIVIPDDEQPESESFKLITGGILEFIDQSWDGVSYWTLRSHVKVADVYAMLDEFTAAQIEYKLLFQ